MTGSSLARRPADANRPTPSGRSTALDAGMTSTQVGPEAAITQPCVVPQAMQPVAVGRQCSEDFSQTVSPAQRLLHEMASESTVSTVKSAALAGVALLARANRSSAVKPPMLSGSAWAI